MRYKQVNPNKEATTTMAKTIADIKSERGIGGPPMLHGSDLPQKVNSVTITVRELREAPANFNSPAIIDLAEPVYGKEAFAVNMTNLRRLAALVGFNDPDTADFQQVRERVLKRKKFKLAIALVNNPKIGKLTRSLFFEE
jgi:hypothetical protein